MALLIKSPYLTTSLTESIHTTDEIISIGLTFASRLKKLSKHRLHSFEKCTVYENQNFQILPQAYSDVRLIIELIEDNEDNRDDILTVKVGISDKNVPFSR